MIAIVRDAFYKHGYLLIIAAWLYTISFVITNYWVSDASPVKVKDKLERKIATAENAIKGITNDTALLKILISNAANEKKLEITKQQFGLYLYCLNDLGSPILNYWNSNVYTIAPADIQQKDGYYFATKQNGNFEIIKKTVFLNHKTIILLAVVPINWDYFIENKYLTKDFEGFPHLDEQYEISTETGALPIMNADGDLLFKIKQKQGHIYAAYDIATIVFRLFFIFVLILFINRVANGIVASHGLPIGMSFLIGTVGIIRFITYVFPFPFNFSRLSLFDPSVYASNFLHPALGHLLVNSVLLCWLAGFWKFHLLKHRPSIVYFRHSWLKYTNIILLLAMAFTMSDITSTLVQDSKISFDVSHFFSLNIFSLVSFITLAFLVLSFYHLSHILLRPLIATRTPIGRQILLLLIAGLCYTTLSIGPSTAVNISVLAWVAGYLLVINWRKEDISLPIQKSTFFIFWVMIFALSIALLISWQNQVVNVAQRKKLAERLALQIDANGENVLSIAVTNINQKSIADCYPRLLAEASNKHIKDSVLNENFTGYLNRFETNIYTFNRFLQPLFNEDTAISYASFQAIINARSKPTPIPNLYAWQNNPDEINYIYSFPIGTDSLPKGYFVLLAKPKKYKSEALYPVLFSQSGDEVSLGEQNQYAYATYTNGKLVAKYNDYDFPLHINSAHLLPYAFVEHPHGNETELWYNASNGKTIIVANSNTHIIEVATLFAYLFFTFLVVIGLFHFGDYLLKTKFSNSVLTKPLRFSMQSKIHATVISISIFSFFVIGAATIYFFINRFNSSNQQRLSANIEMIANEIGVKLQQVQQQKILDDGIAMYDIGYSNNFERDITEVSETHNVDINFYSLSGNLIASTQPHIYSKQLLSTKINPIALYHLQYDGRSRFVQTENIGQLSYLSMYMPIVDETGKTYAYINIPYLNSQLELNQEISSFIATIINLNAFIFLIAGAIAFLITRGVVASFSIIANKMKEVNIGKKNEAIVWDKDDEIGELVTEYNKMVLKLEQSADALARSEREGAWREMAKQVAHEIKNPLTPMKLSIQYLQRAINNDMPNVKELAQKVATTLIDQIEQLAQISSDFSQFANIGNAVMEEVNISEKLHGIVQLYRQSGSVTIRYEQQPPHIVLGDKIQLSRLFTNLIKNAVESVEDGSKCLIEITQVLASDHVTIAIKDNGKGIDPETALHIFQPNFTTKTSGTGLGLAICKGIVEKLKGTISFETEVGKGTVFIVTLPLVNGLG
ncbi:sensor histidine kinase [Parasediminibacterium sp. JCM 36343]|uniref:sensor histidine kinase n=1 Tax=Parasediminibacterium sp. JCM 36343 TaxID=3374279 RepID=UPI00397CE2C6